ncbi:MAG: S8 family serine peptidase [Flavisolibacter sp.]
MKLNRLPFLIFFLSLSLFSFCQDHDNPIFLRTGTVHPEANIRQGFIDSLNRSAVRVDNTSLVVLQFEKIPGDNIRKALSLGGIELLDYVSGNAYTATIRGDLTAAGLRQAHVRSVLTLSPAQKIHPLLLRKAPPSWAVRSAGTVDVWISFPRTFPVTEVISHLKQLNIDVLGMSLQAYGILPLRLASGRLAELASLPFVEYVQPSPPQDQPLNNVSRTDARANILNASLADGGRALNGEGVVIGIGDNADIQGHMDFSGRLIDRAPIPSSAHGMHVSGTFTGAGNINPLYRGYAPKATVVSQAFNGIIINAPVYVRDYGMVVTNNSYGDIIECDYNGTYDLVSRYMDQMAIDYPNLENVFAAGNSGTSTCTPFAPGYATVLGGYQSAKNVLTVGATNDTGAMAPFSSLGPVKDGRTKPEIVTMGQRVVSTWPTNTYASNQGTSMAAPAASGGLALLYQRYRQLHGGDNPKNGLMKALLCNGASDKGNPGPDYQYGFGWMNLLRSLDMLENGHYLQASAANGTTGLQDITIPAGTAELKVMLYWNDPAASLFSTKTLVNDLDLQLIDPSAQTLLPQVPDTAIARVNQPSLRAADHINNMEQVVVDHPTAGHYQARILGTAIAQNPSQEYFLVYDIIPVQLKITAPAGGEGLVPGETTRISWEAHGFPSGTVRLESSFDGGLNWTLITSGWDLNRNYFSWTVPSQATDRALIRITKEGTGETDTSHPFVILAQPTLSLAATQCESYINLTWTPAAGATDYAIMMLRGDEMKILDSTTSTQYIFSGLSRDSIYWVTVCPRIAGKAGRRSVALSRQPNTGTCSGSLSDNDLKLDAILSPVTGRNGTSTQPGAAATVSIRVRNLDDAPSGSFDLKYALNGGPWVTETVTTPIAAGGSYTHLFSTPVDLSAPGTYRLAVVVKHANPDPVPVNDTLTSVIRHLDNPALDLTGFFVDDLEAAAVQTYQDSLTGLEGITRYDFSPGTVWGRGRTFLNTGIAYSGSRALTLDVSKVYNPGSVNYLYGTFNLSGYHAAGNDLRLDFEYLNHGQTNSPVNKVWIRGNDHQPWIEVYDLYQHQMDPGSYQKTPSLELSDSLLGAGQDFSSSFQVRWGQFGQVPATDRTLGGGYTFDDIRLYQVFNDMQMKSIDAPTGFNCGLTSNTPIRISVRNSANYDITNIPVRYRVNQNAWVTEIIPAIPANTTLPYSFSTPADLSANGSYTLQAVVSLGNDSYRDNDTVTLALRNAPVIAQYPYLQNFENGDGYWFTGGINSSWQYGTPASPNINRAASGARAWKTSLQDHYNDNEFSYLYSPCFDLSGLSRPTLSFSMALDVEDCGASLCDAAWVEYSTDGTLWKKLGAVDSGTNWYNKPTGQLWSEQGNYHWHVATSALPNGINRLRLRFVLQSDQGVNREGLAIDDVHVYDNTSGIYDSVSMTTPQVQTVSGNQWIDFTRDGKLIASLQPRNQSLGATAVQAYIYPGPVRNNNQQYYHNRNLRIIPAAPPADSVTIRFYFLDRETDSLIQASGCNSCVRPSSAYDLGISRYSDADTSFENGSLSDDQQGSWSFIPWDQLKIVPFDKGYYAEFAVKGFSEFWLSKGGFDRSTPLPVKMMDFRATRGSGTTVLLDWTVASETDVARYEIEVARGSAEQQAGRFVKTGEVTGEGYTTATRHYQFADNEADKFGPQYYRLKIINQDGSFSYSAIRSVLFDEAVLWQVYPNPSTGKFQLVYQLNNGEKMQATLHDATGRLVWENSQLANGFPQKFSINISNSNYPPGVYLLHLQGPGTQRVFRLTKH